MGNNLNKQQIDKLKCERVDLAQLQKFIKNIKS